MGLVPSPSAGQEYSFLRGDGQWANPATSSGTTTVATIAELKALSVSDYASNDAVTVLGYYSAGDGGNGIFRYDSGSATTDNGGTVIAPSSGSGRWLRVYDTSLNLLWFGADRTGATSCTAALNAALALIAPVNGGIIFCPQGSYLFSTKPNAIDGGVTLQGEGMGRTVLIRGYAEADATRGFIDMTCSSGRSNAGGGLSNLQISLGAGTSGGSAINIESSSTVGNGLLTIQEVNVSGAGSCNYSLRLDGSAKTASPQGVRTVTVLNSYFFQADIQGIYAKSVNHLSIVNTGVFATGANPNAGLVVDGTVASPTNNVIASMEFCSTVSLAPTGTCNAIHVESTNANQLTVTGSLTNAIAKGPFTTLTGSCPTLTLIRPGSVALGGNLAANGAPGAYSIESKGAVAGYVEQSSTVKVGTIGVPYLVVCANLLTFSFTLSTGKLFHLSTGGGASALVFADYKQTTITIVADPSSEFQASSTPSAGKTGIFKSANSHNISVKNNTGSTVNYGILAIGEATSVTAPA